jgi:threonine aldolase
MRPPDPGQQHADALRRQCTVFVPGHPSSAPGAELERVAAWCRENGFDADRYGEGALIGQFEARVAALLGKPTAVFMPSGTMAQQIALRIWCERAGLPRVAMHPTSHLELHEERGYARLHGLQAVLLGPRARPTLPRDLASCPERVAALVVELPAREIGGQLPLWDDLVELAAAAGRRRVRMHMDGARLWEAREFYAPRSLADVGALFDSIYVSFYKGIGALAGALLAGPEDFIAEARVWRRRHGGNLPQFHPFVASAAMRLEAQLARMPAYLARARSLAAELSRLEGVAIVPNPPQVNMFHLHFTLSADALTAARDRIAAEERVWLAPRFEPGEAPATSRFELYVGDNLLALDDATVMPLFLTLLHAARAGAR